MESGHRVSIPLKHWQKYVLCSLAPVKWKRLVRQESTHHTEEYNKEWTMLATNGYFNWWCICWKFSCQLINNSIFKMSRNSETIHYSLLNSKTQTQKKQVNNHPFLINYCLKWLTDYGYQFVFFWLTDRLIGFSVSALKKWIKPKKMLNTRTSWPFGSHFGVKM